MMRAGRLAAAIVLAALLSASQLGGM